MKLIFLLALATYSILSTSDPIPLRDFCVSTDDPKKLVYVNGKHCKDPKLVGADDFYFQGIDVRTDTRNIWGANGTIVDVNNLGGINTLGVSVSHSDFAPKGVNPPHTNIRSAEVFTVLKGKFLVGFVTSNRDGNHLFSKILNKGDVFVFPMGLVHFQVNVGNTRGATFHAWGSQDSGYYPVPNAVFGSTPRIDLSFLSKAFHVKDNIIEDILSQSFPRLGVDKN